MSRLAPRAHVLGATRLLTIATMAGFAVSANAAETHHWGFNTGDGTQILDEIGNADGFASADTAGTPASLVNVTDGFLSLNSTGQLGEHGFISDAVNEIGINTYTEFTFEAWMAQSGPTNWSWLAGFGNTTTDAACNGCGIDYLMFNTVRANADGSRFAITPNWFDAEVGVTDGNRDLNGGQLRHVVGTVSPTEISYYVDGVQIGTASLIDPETELPITSLADVDPTNVFFGRSLYTGDSYMEGRIHEITLYDNVLTPEEVLGEFQAGCEDAEGCGSGMVLTIDRLTGEGVLSNDLSPLSMIVYSMTSTAGALDPVGWNSIAETGDVDNGGSIDPDDNWSILTQTVNELSETNPFEGAGPDDGVSVGADVPLGKVWEQSPFEDVQMTITYLDELFQEIPLGVTVEFINGESLNLSDLDLDGDSDADDYGILIDNHLQPLAGATRMENFGLGDIDGDGDNDFDDWRAFANDYIAVNGAEAFSLLAAIPEPSTAVLTLAALSLVGARRRNG